MLRGEYNSKLLLLEFEVANVVAKGRVREKDKENVVKGHEVKSGQRRIWSKIWSMAKMWSIAKMWSMELMVGGKDVVDGKDKVQRTWSKKVVGCNLARGND